MSTSLYDMIDRVHGMIGTSDLNDWETEFIESVMDRCPNKDSRKITPKQAEIVERIFKKHFAA